MSEKLKPPQKIYLQDYCEDYLSDGNTTWCDDKQNDDDIEYILRSEYNALRAENERLREALKYIVDRGYTGASYVAQQTLNEVNNVKN